MEKREDSWNELKRMTAVVNPVLEKSRLRLRPIADLLREGVMTSLWLERRYEPYWRMVRCLAVSGMVETADKGAEALLDAWSGGLDVPGVWLPSAGSLEELCLKLAFAGA